jgi:hypothetical protein
MSKYFEISIALLSLGLANSIVTQAIASERYEKNRMPCVAEVCIQDNIQELTNINWIPVDKELRNVPNKNQNKGWKAIGDSKALQNLLPYLSGGIIDKKGIKLLPQIKGFCTMPRFNPIFLAHYIGKDGKHVQVTFSLLPSSDQKSQKIVVSEIKKLISNTEISPSQTESLFAEAEKRYPSSNKGGSPTTVLIQPDINYGKVTSVNLRLLQGNLFGSAGSLLEFPGCTGNVNL